MKKAGLILFYVFVVALTYTITDRTIDYLRRDASVNNHISAERNALLELERIKKFEVPELITNLAHVDGDRHGFGEPGITA